MADGVTVDNGEGTDYAVATDDVDINGQGVKHVQYMKLADGTNGGTGVIGGDATNGLDVDVTRVSGTVTVDSELPAAAVLADNAANPTAPAVGAFGMVWDGSTWDRLAGTSTDGALVNLGANNDVTVTGTVAISGTVAVTDNSGSLTVDGSVTANPTRPATPTQSSVADTATSTTLLASNANRLGATIYNDSTVNLYVKLGATASATSFTVKLEPDAYYEVPFGYTGIIDGIWASDASGSARITELAA